ncbi:hypothetical protein [Paraflavitalea speifideaquila]|uniref:hypothetical protein n=1 Tax=Paraflavitalea speifideaquila TaxID=3076558 RepID=UPI0028EE3CC0|nr:hypothetical protein [Paraflavitalea speifideiaquila]
MLNDQLADQRWMGEQDIQQQNQAMKTINNLTRELNNSKLTEAERTKRRKKEQTTNCS